MKTIKIILVMVMTMVCVSINAQRWTYDRVVAERNHRELVKSIDKLTEATKELTRATKEANGYSSSSSYNFDSDDSVNPIRESCQLCPKDDKVYISDGWKLIETTDSTNSKPNVYYRNGIAYMEYPTEFIRLIKEFETNYRKMILCDADFSMKSYNFSNKHYEPLFKKYGLSQEKAREELSNMKSGYIYGKRHFKTKEDCHKAIADLQAFKEKYKEILKRL